MNRRTFLTAVLCSSAVPVAAQQPTFSVRRETVRVDVLVTERGRPVLELKAADFEVFDSGVRQDVDLATFAELPLSVAFALDVSTSISREQLTHLRQGTAAVLDNFKAADQSALITFADAVAVRRPLSGDPAGIRAALDGMSPSQRPFGGTALIDACYTAMSLLADDPGRGLLIAFTDGVDTSSWLQSQAVLQAARRANVVVYSVSTSPLPKGSFLRELTDASGGDAIEITSTDAIRSTFVRILDEFRQRYLVSYSPTGVPGSGWHPLTVRVRNRRVDVRARAGYMR